MMVHMRHMGTSGKFAVIAAIVAGLLLVLTGMTLAEPVFVAFLGVLLLAALAAIWQMVVRGRRAALLAAGAGTSLTIGFALAFVSTWELAYADQSSFLGTPLPTDDPDNYFFGAAAAAVATLLVLFLGAAWPAGGRPGNIRRKPAPAKRRPVSSSGRTPARGTAQRAATQRTATQRAATPGSGTQRAGTQGSAAQRASGSRAPARLPAAAAVRKPASRSAPKPGSKTASGR